MVVYLNIKTQKKEIKNLRVLLRASDPFPQKNENI